MHWMMLHQEDLSNVMLVKDLIAMAGNTDVGDDIETDKPKNSLNNSNFLHSHPIMTTKISQMHSLGVKGIPLPLAGHLFNHDVRIEDNSADRSCQSDRPLNESSIPIWEDYGKKTEQ